MDPVPHSVVNLTCVVVEHILSAGSACPSFLFGYGKPPEAPPLMSRPHTACPVPGQAVTCERGSCGGRTDFLYSSVRGTPRKSHGMNDGLLSIWVPSLTPVGPDHVSIPCE